MSRNAALISTGKSIVVEHIDAAGLRSNGFRSSGTLQQVAGDFRLLTHIGLRQNGFREVFRDTLQQHTDTLWNIVDSTDGQRISFRSGHDVGLQALRCFQALLFGIVGSPLATVVGIRNVQLRLCHHGVFCLDGLRLIDIAGVAIHLDIGIHLRRFGNVHLRQFIVQQVVGVVAIIFTEEVIHVDLIRIGFCRGRQVAYFHQNIVIRHGPTLW